MRPRHLLLLAVALLVAAQALAWFAGRTRRAEQAATGSIAIASPGEFAGTLMLGGLRGLATDILWLRASQAKQARRFYESLALYELITRAQPRFEQVWEYLAHDLAFNIAFETKRDDMAISWLRAGVEANVRGSLRNPGSEPLLRNLAWIFFQKGGSLQAQVERLAWADLLNPVFARHSAVQSIPTASVVQRGDAPAGAVPSLLAQVGPGAPALTRLWDEGSLVNLHDGQRVLGSAVLGTPSAEGWPLLEVEASGDLAVAIKAGNLRCDLRLTPAALAERCYRCAYLVGQASGTGPAFARRMVPIAIERDGQAARNRGDYRRALLRWVDCVESWNTEVKAWHDSAQAQASEDPQQIVWSVESYQRNESRVRLRVIHLSDQLAKDPGTATAMAQAIDHRDLEAARRLLANRSLWRDSLLGGGIRFLDE